MAPVETADPLRIAACLREVLPNPFRNVGTAPRMAGHPTVTELCGLIAKHDRYADLPILADALEEAGLSGLANAVAFCAMVAIMARVAGRSIGHAGMG